MLKGPHNLLLRAPGESTQRMEPSGLITHLAIETTAADALFQVHLFQLQAPSQSFPKICSRRLPQNLVSVQRKSSYGKAAL